MKGLPKSLFLQHLDQIMVESQTNSVLPFSKTIHSRTKKDKMANVIAILAAGLSILYCRDDFEQEFKINYVSDGEMI